MRVYCPATLPAGPLPIPHTEQRLAKRQRAREIVKQFKELVNSQDSDYDDIIEWQVAAEGATLTVLSVYVNKNLITLDVEL